MKYLELLVNAVKEKTELSKVDSDFISSLILEFVKKYDKISKKIENSDSFEKFKHSKEYKLILKSIRANIRKSYVLFQIDPKSRANLFDALKNNPESLELHEKILATHRSTKERQEIYSKLYQDIFKLTKKPASILDLGCGLNPFSFPWMGLRTVEYIAVELNKSDLKLIDEYFSLMRISHLAIPINLIKEYKKLINFSVDVCFMFKLLDSLETSQKNISYELIQSINAKYVVVSFSTKTVGGKPMRTIRRKWFEALITKRGYEFKILEYENEIFYIVSKLK